MGVGGMRSFVRLALLNKELIICFETGARDESSMAARVIVINIILYLTANFHLASVAPDLFIKQGLMQSPPSQSQ
jgi:hypothetical protein